MSSSEPWGACGQVDKALDSRSEGLGFDSCCWSCVEAYTASVHPAVMGTWWNKKLENCEWH